MDRQVYTRTELQEMFRQEIAACQRLHRDYHQNHPEMSRRFVRQGEVIVSFGEAFGFRREELM